MADPAQKLVEVRRPRPSAAIALFTWRVFRPTDRPAALLFALIAGILLALGVNQYVVGGATPGSSPAFWIGVLTTVVALCWAMTDSFAYYRASHSHLLLSPDLCHAASGVSSHTARSRLGQAG